MSELLNEVGAFLVSNGVGTLDADIFKTYLPDDPVITAQTVVAILESPHAPAEEVFGQDAVLELRFQIVVRGPDYLTAYNKAVVIRNLLHDVSNLDIGAARYLRIRALQSRPFPLGGPDDKGRWRLALNYAASRKP